MARLVDAKHVFHESGSNNCDLISVALRHRKSRSKCCGGRGDEFFKFCWNESRILVQARTHCDGAGGARLVAHSECGGCGHVDGSL